MNRLMPLVFVLALAAPEVGIASDAVPSECEQAWKIYQEAQTPGGIEWQLLQDCLDKAPSENSG